MITPDFDQQGHRQPDEDPFGDLLLGSQNYWAGKTGREDPPAPTYRLVDGQQKLGRYMDPWGCQAHMRSARQRWRKYYLSFYVSLGASVIFLGVDWFVAIFLAPVFAALYFYMKAKHRSQFNQYYDIQERMLATGQPEWVPYDKDRLKMLEKTAGAVWP